MNRLPALRRNLKDVTGRDAVLAAVGTREAEPPPRVEVVEAADDRPRGRRDRDGAAEVFAPRAPGGAEGFRTVAERLVIERVEGLDQRADDFRPVHGRAGEGAERGGR